MLNFAGQLAPLAAGVVSIPYVIHRLGVDRFSVLSLAWVLLTYLTLLDLGFGRAAVRFLSDALGRNDEASLPKILWTSLGVQLVLGVAGSAVLALATPALVTDVLKVPGWLVRETIDSFRVLALSIPVLLSVSSLRGVLESHQRFDLVNIVRGSANSMIFVGPAVAAAAGLDLVGVMVVIDLAMLASALAYLVLDFRVQPLLRGVTIDASRVWPLFRFGGWVTLSGLLVPALASSDRLLISWLLGVGTLAYYTVPYEVAFRLQTIPASFASVLFPAFAHLNASRREQLPNLYAGSLKYLLAVMAVAGLPIALYAHPILQIWINTAFADRGAAVLQILVLGMLLNALAQIPGQIIDAAGRPDIRAKIFMGYLPVYLAIAYLLIAHQGILGAGFAWTTRAAIEAALFFAFSIYVLRLRVSALWSADVARAVATVAVVAALATILILSGGFLRSWYWPLAGVLSVALPLVTWTFVFEKDERRRLIQVVLAWRARTPEGLRAIDENVVPPAGDGRSADPRVAR